MMDVPWTALVAPLGVPHANNVTLAVDGHAELALSSLISDLGKHEDTSRIMTPEMCKLATGEYQLAGVEGVRRFIEGLASPPDPMAVPETGAETVE